MHGICSGHSPKRRGSEQSAEKVNVVMEKAVDITLDDIWQLYCLMHQADTPTETVVAAVDAYLRRAWLRTWIERYANYLKLLGVDRIVFERSTTW